MNRRNLTKAVLDLCMNLHWVHKATKEWTTRIIKLKAITGNQLGLWTYLMPRLTYKSICQIQMSTIKSFVKIPRHFQAKVIVVPQLPSVLVRLNPETVEFNSNESLIKSRSTRRRDASPHPYQVIMWNNFLQSSKTSHKTVSMRLSGEATRKLGWNSPQQSLPPFCPPGKPWGSVE